MDLSSPVALIFLGLLTAHLAGDFLLQTEHDIRHKTRPLVFLKHVGIHALLAWVLVGIVSLWIVPVVILVTHAIIDALKIRVARRSQWAFWVDQAAHIAVLIGLTAFVARADCASLWLQCVDADWLAKAFVLASGLLIAVRMSGIVIGMWIAPWLAELQDASSSIHTEPRGLAKGGSIIGQLERLLIFMLVVSGQPEGVGFLVAAKSIFRFGELRDTRNRKEAEYITIGTLMSFACGLAVSLATHWLLA